MSQTNYKWNMDMGIAGQVVDLSVSRIDSYVCQGGGIKPGFGVVWGSSQDYKNGKVRVPAATTDKFAGVATTQAMEQKLYTGEVVFDDGDSISLINGIGRVYVQIVGAAVAGDKAAVICSGANAGKFCSASNATITDKITTNCVIRMDVTDGLTLLEMKEGN